LLTNQSKHLVGFSFYSVTS